MNIFWTIVIGILIALITRAFVPRMEAKAAIMLSLIGIAGAFIGAAIARTLGICEHGQAACFVCSAVGALAFTYIYRLIAPISAPSKIS